MGFTRQTDRQIEFRLTGSQHVHLFLQIFIAPNDQNKAGYIEFIDETINPQFQDDLSDPNLFELVKTY